MNILLLAIKMHSHLSQLKLFSKRCYPMEDGLLLVDLYIPIPKIVHQK
jgi:hypothetical protein